MVNAGQRSCACDWLCWYVATGTRRGKHCALFCLATGYPAAGSMRRRLDKLVRRRFEDHSMGCLLLVLASAGLGIVSVDYFCRKKIIGFVFQSLLVLYIGRLGLRIVISFPILSKYFQPFAPYLLNPRTLFSRELSGDFPSFPVVVLLVRGCEGERQYRTLIYPAGIVSTMSRVVNYHSSWARQQQVELLDAPGNPGSTAGRGFNPAGGASGGG
ncbi:multidrug resistance pump [Dorcoceras hygrometricum]|uniref:Multidrug resistance pump n=1 Tax=Dorcoceras hygrometricum TaxID=472368 RepID=A0A2Z7ALD2_9LAMI|nr:multidrug resistance pump [Dorcoceras hygrometricum]